MENLSSLKNDACHFLETVFEQEIWQARASNRCRRHGHIRGANACPRIDLKPWNRTAIADAHRTEAHLGRGTGHSNGAINRAGARPGAHQCQAAGDIYELRIGLCSQRNRGAGRIINGLLQGGVARRGWCAGLREARRGQYRTGDEQQQTSSAGKIAAR